MARWTRRKGIGGKATSRQRHIDTHSLASSRPSEAWSALADRRRGSRSGGFGRCARGNCRVHAGGRLLAGQPAIVSHSRVRGLVHQHRGALRDALGVREWASRVAGSSGWVVRKGSTGDVSGVGGVSHDHHLSKPHRLDSTTADRRHACTLPCAPSGLGDLDPELLRGG